MNAIRRVLIGLFLVWLAGTICLLIVLQDKPSFDGWMIVIFGQYFLVGGITGLISDRRRNPTNRRSQMLPTLVCTLLGSGMIAGGLVVQFGNTEAKALLPAVVMCLMLLMAPVIGIGLLWNYYRKHIVFRRKCSHQLKAECAYLIFRLSKSNRRSTNRKVYNPVYRYIYQGKTYMSSSGTYSDLRVPRQHDECMIWIDPENPERIYDDRGRGIMLVTAIILLFVSIYTSRVLMSVVIPGFIK